MKILVQIFEKKKKNKKLKLKIFYETTNVKQNSYFYFSPFKSFSFIFVLGVSRDCRTNIPYYFFLQDT